MTPIIVKNIQSDVRKSLGVYIHVPFCQSKCSYCDFYSFRPKSPEAMEHYVNVLIQHMESYRETAKGYTVDTVYIGGGTPTALDPKLLIKLIRAIKRNFTLAIRPEFTVEANPATVDLKTLRRLRRAGVNRLSIGLQSANDNELALLGRTHTREDFERSFRDARKAKINNISVDVMFGIPDQTPESLMRTLRYVTKLEPEHISMYDLKIEPNTVFGRRAGELNLPDENTEADMYLMAVDYLGSRGYNQYEISNFCRPGYRSRHNMKYWNCEEYLGFGASAHSFFNGYRFAFIRHAGKYMQAIEDPSADICIAEQNEAVGEKERMGEYIMLRLRLTDGISDREFMYRFGKSFEAMYGRKLQRYVKGGFVNHVGDTYSLSPQGMFVSNYILTDILDFADNGEFAFNGIN